MIKYQENTGKAVSEADAAREYARAWNRLDPSRFLSLLADEARYASQWVFEELETRAAIADYLTGKMKTIRNLSRHNPNYKVLAELGKISAGVAGRDCVFMAQGKKESITGVVLFEIGHGQITRFDMCIPELLGVIRSGIYPI